MSEAFNCSNINIGSIILQKYYKKEAKDEKDQI